MKEKTNILILCLSEDKLLVNETKTEFMNAQLRKRKMKKNDVGNGGAT